MSKKMPAKRLIGLLVGLVVMASLAVAPVSAGSGPLPGHFQGDAYGNRANAQAGEIATALGRSAFQPCPCLGTDGEVIHNSVHDVQAGNVYRAGHVYSTVQAMKQSGQRAFVQTTSRIVDVSALDGYITADVIDASATTRATASSFSVTPAGSAIANLRIGGLAVQVNPGARINLPGFGYVVIYDIDKFGNGRTSRGIQVEMLRIVITRENVLDIPIGAIIVVGHARSGYSRFMPTGIVTGAAWGSQAWSVAGNIVNGLGRSAAVYMGCHSKGTQTKTNRVNSTTVPGVLATDVVLSELYGSISPSLVIGRASSKLVNVNLLNGLLTADVIRGVATSRLTGAGGTTSFEGSKFVDLRVLGIAIGDNVARNTVVVIPGLGLLTLYATSSDSGNRHAEASVFMVILNVTLPNTLGIPVGTEIRLARARAGAER